MLQKFKFIPKRFRHWTPKYIANRIETLWFNFSNPDAPWLTKTAVKFLELWFSEKDVGLE